MVELIISDADADQLKSSQSPVLLRRANGEVLGIVVPPRVPDEFDLMMIERIKASRNLPRTYRTTEQVMERLRQLEAGECAGK